jgi:hypothetical protein
VLRDGAVSDGGLWSVDVDRLATQVAIAEATFGQPGDVQVPITVVGGYDQVAQGVVTATDRKVVELEDARRGGGPGPDSFTGSIRGLHQQVDV